MNGLGTIKKIEVKRKYIYLYTDKKKTIIFPKDKTKITISCDLEEVAENYLNKMRSFTNEEEMAFENYKKNNFKKESLNF